MVVLHMAKCPYCKGEVTFANVKMEQKGHGFLRQESMYICLTVIVLSQSVEENTCNFLCVRACMCVTHASLTGHPHLRSRGDREGDQAEAQ